MENEFFFLTIWAFEKLSEISNSENLKNIINFVISNEKFWR